MRLSYFALCGAILAGCASRAASPVATSATPADTSVEVRHMYLFAPGKPPVRIVDRESPPSSAQEISSELPEIR